MSSAHVTLTAVLAVVLTTAIALPASAHAVLTDTDPGDGAVLDAPPGQITFFFNEEIESALAQIQVLDGEGDRVDDGAPGSAADSAAVTMAVTTGTDGEWTAAFRVVSADGHPIQGQISFTVESGADVEEGDTAADEHGEDAGLADPAAGDRVAAGDDDTAEGDAPSSSEQVEEEATAIVDDGTPLGLLIAAGLLAGLAGLIMGLRRRRARTTGTSRT